MIYCDYNAGGPVRPEVAEAMAGALAIGGNPSSVHAAGRRARQALDEARAEVAALAGAAPDQVVFTSGATEANALALRGVGRGPVLVSAIEHDSVLAQASEAARIAVTADGVVDLDALAARLAVSRAPRLVSVMTANNETGVVQPMAEIVRLAHARGALVHCDAVQAAGRLALDFAGAGLDLMSLSGHKIGAAPGVGALIVADHVRLAPLLRGGGQERRRRAGTENLPGIVGFGRAARLARDSIADGTRIAALRDRLEAALGDPALGAVVYGAGAPRLANTSCLAMPGVAGETQVMAFDLAGIAVGAGAACSSGKIATSHVLGAMGVVGAAAGEAIRISLGWASRDADVDHLIETWRALRETTLRQRAGASARAAA